MPTKTTKKPIAKTKRKVSEKVIASIKKANAVKIQKGSLGGRPTEYTSDMTKKGYEYLSNIGTEKGNKNELPTKAKLAKHLGIWRQRIDTWCSLHYEFADMVEELMQQQEDYLIQRGLTRKYSSSITRLILGKHGYKEQVEETIRVPSNEEDLDSLSDEQLDAIINEPNKR